LGIYKKGETPGTQYAAQWQYVSGKEGVLELKVSDEGEYFVVLFEDDGYKELSNRVNFTVSANVVRQTQVQMGTVAKARVYPNPMTSNTVVEAPAPIRKLELFDSVSGKLVWQMNQLKQKRVRLPKHRLAVGNYLIKVYADKLYTLKAVVK
jgi:hypothetical protein